MPLLILAQSTAQFEMLNTGSSAYHHLQDMKRIRSFDIFDGSFKNNGEAKPVMIVTVDGVPDENPRYIKTVERAIDYF